jgi:hypothetical protein
MYVEWHIDCTQDTHIAALSQNLDWRTFHILFETDTVGFKVLRIEKLLDASIAAHSLLCLIVTQLMSMYACHSIDCQYL